MPGRKKKKAATKLTGTDLNDSLITDYFPADGHVKEEVDSLVNGSGDSDGDSGKGRQTPSEEIESVPERPLSSSDGSQEVKECTEMNRSDTVIKEEKFVDTAPADTKPKRPSRKKSATSKAEKQTSKTTARKKPTESRKLTEFFPVRRSSRVPQSELKAKEQKLLEDAILGGRVDGLEVRDFEGKGRGVVAIKTFSRGDFVVEYAGDLIDRETAKKREKSYSKDSDVGCYMYYFNFNNAAYCVDATAESGKLGRLLNHSKNGNCQTRVVGIDNKPYLILVAARDIALEEELLYDYGDRDKETLEAHPWLRL